MSLSIWLHHVAVRGCLIAIVSFVSLSGECCAQQNNVTPGQKIESQQPIPNKLGALPAGQQTQAIPVVGQQKSNGLGYDPRCEAPQNREDADLCEQRRMSKAAEDAAWWAEFQSVLGIAGFSAVVISLLFSGWATYDATRANDIMRQQFIQEQRPWVDIDLLNIEEIVWDRKRPFFFNVSMENVGKTPAFDGRVFVGLYEASSAAFSPMLEGLVARYNDWSHPGLKLLPNKPRVGREVSTVPSNFFSEDGSVLQPSVAISICVFFGYKDSSRSKTYYTVKNYLLSLKAGGKINAEPSIKGGAIQIYPDGNRTDYV